MDKWKKLKTLILYLEQGREIEIDGVNYGISEDGDIIRMYCDDMGVIVPSLKHIWNIIEKISEENFTLMCAEKVLQEINTKNR